MKKSIACITLIFAVLFGFAACGKGEKETETETMTETVAYFVDDEGVSHEVESSVDENGETKYSYNDGGNVVTVQNKDIVVATTVISVNKTTAQKNSLNADEAAESLLAELTKNIAQNQTQTKVTLLYEEPLSPDSTSILATTRNSNGEVVLVNPIPKKSYQEMIDSGTYTMKFTLKTTDSSGTTTVPVTMVMSGNKAFVAATMTQDKTNLEVNYINDGTKGYFVIPAIKAYTEADQDFVKEIMPDLSETAKDDAKLVEAVSATVDGKSYICETYDLNGEQVKYYYLPSGDLNRIETNNPDTGTKTIMQINSLTAVADQRLFKIPNGYIDLASLGEKYNFDDIV